MIAGLKGREPVGVVLSMGIKGPADFPIEKDRFHLVEPRENAERRRDHHVQFARYNAAKPEARQSIRGVIVHKTQDECFRQQRRLHIAPKSYKGPKSAPNRRPFCMSPSGDKAMRFIGDSGFKEQACLGDRCEFADDCKPTTALYFQLRWTDPSWPSLLCRFDSHGWRTAANLLGFFDYWREAGMQLIGPEHSLWGIPFVLTMSMQTAPNKSARFPVISMAPDGLSPPEFFMQQRVQLRALGGSEPQVAAMTGSDDADIEAETWNQLSGPKP